MGEKPILFSAPMVNAILNGRKTMTRRVVKNDAKCPYESGDLLWVRETFAVNRVGGQDLVFYRADCGSDGDGAKWKPSIFMPRKYSRITLRITDVRSERLQEITAVDMRAEGIDCLYENDGSISEHFTRQSWVNLLDSINAKRGFGWDANPWVWVVSFEKL